MSTQLSMSMFSFTQLTWGCALEHASPYDLTKGEELTGQAASKLMPCRPDRHFVHQPGDLEVCLRTLS